MMAQKDFEIGDLIWVKRKNFPCWPAKIADPPTVLEEDFRTANGLQNMEKSERRKAQHYVLFFGSQDYAWVWDENIVPHSVEILHTNTPKSTLYEKAIDEIIAAGGVSVPNLKLVKKEPVDNGQSRIETKQKIKVEKTDDEIRLEFVRRSSRLLKKIKIEKKEEPSENELIKDPTIKDYKLSEESKSIKTKKLVEEDESSKNFSAVKTLGKTTNIPYVADDKDSTVLSIKKRTSKEKIKKTASEKEFDRRSMLGNDGTKDCQEFLLESGRNVSIWNRTLDKCTQFVAAGAHKFLTPCDVVLNCDIIFCCVSGPEATKSVVFGNRGILQGFQKCKTATKGFVVLSALDLQISQEIASAVTSEGGNYLDAPIRGSIFDAEASTLLIIVAGVREFFNDCVTCFHAISKHAFYLGRDIGSASIMHTYLSLVNGATTVAFAEVMCLVDELNFSKNSFQESVLSYLP
ncbi:putative oxidoreductase GLYR1 homolog [Trichonephila clavipes]|nr:putative oxidoreductase GLYR1 homolog [Trichonephila clavipes]